MAKNYGTDYDAMVRDAMRDPVIRQAYEENQIRRRLGDAFEAARIAKGWTIRQLAARLGTSISQTQRVLHQEQGSNLTLSTIVSAADVLGLELRVSVEPRTETETVQRPGAGPKAKRVPKVAPAPVARPTKRRSAARSQRRPAAA